MPNRYSSPGQSNHYLIMKDFNTRAYKLSFLFQMWLKKKQQQQKLKSIKLHMYKCSWNSVRYQLIVFTALWLLWLIPQLPGNTKGNSNP